MSPTRDIPLPASVGADLPAMTPVGAMAVWRPNRWQASSYKGHAPQNL
jgi:hypothetical protein